MKLPRDLSGADLVKVLCRYYGYSKINQQGSHIILQTDEPQPHRLAVPDHSPLRPGTLNAILNAVSRIKQIDKAQIIERL